MKRDRVRCSSCCSVLFFALFVLAGSAGSRAADAPPRHRALVIGVESPAGSPARRSANDTRAVADALRKAGYGTVVRLAAKPTRADLRAAGALPARDDAGAAAADLQPTRRNIERWSERLLREDLGPQDSVLVYFSGPVLVDAQGGAYLAGADTGTGDPAEAAVPLTRVRALLAECGAGSRVLVLDAFHAPAVPAGKESAARLAPGAPHADGRAYEAARAPEVGVVAACDAGQASWALAGGARGVFAHYLALGLSGKADGNGDRQVDAAELFGFVSAEVAAWANEHAVEQSPRVSLAEGAGSVVVARSPRGGSSVLPIVGGVAALGGLAAVVGGGGGGRTGSRDQTPPAIVAVVLADSTHVDVRFSEPLDPRSVGSPGDYAIVPHVEITAVELLPDGATVRLTVNRPDPGATYTVGVPGVRDATGNAAPVGSTAALEVPPTPPVVAAVTPTDSTHMDVRFDQVLQGASVNLLTNYQFEPPLPVLGAELQSDGRTIRLATAEQTEGQTYRLTVTGVTNPFGQAVAGAAGTATLIGTGVPPRVAGVTALDSTHVAVTFDEAMETTSASTITHYAVTPELGVIAAAYVPDERMVRLTTAEHRGGAAYALTVSGVMDRAGNPVGDGSGGAFTGIGDPPRVLGAAAVDSTHVDVQFTEPLVLDAAGTTTNYTFTPPLSVTAAALQPDGKVVRLATAEQRAGDAYALQVVGMKDLVGNPMGPGGQSVSLAGIGVPPEVVSAATVDSTHVDVVFNEALDPTTAGATVGYAISPSLAVLSATLRADGKSVRLATAEQHAGTEYTLTVSGVTDVAGNPVGATGNAVALGGQGTPPQVVSLAAVDATHFDVLFSEVVNVGDAGTVANYAVAPALALLAAEVQPDGRVARLTTAEQTDGVSYTVTVSGVRDAAGNLMGADHNAAAATGIGDPPRVASVLAADSTHVDVVFSEAVDAASAGLPANYTCSPALAIAAAEVQPDGKSVRLATAEQTTGVIYTLTLAGIRDPVGNPIGAAGNTGSFTGVGVAPQVVSAAAVDSTHVLVAFSEEVAPAEAEAPASYALAPALPIAAAQRQADGKSVLLTVTEQTGGAAYTLTVSGVRDLAGNPIGATGNAASFTGVGAAPRVVSAAAVDSTHVDVLFNEPLDAAPANAPASYAIAPSLAVSGAALQADGRTVRLATAEQHHGQPYLLTVSGVRDAAGNPIGATANTAGFTGIGVAPQVVSAAAVDSTHVDVAFNEAMDAPSANTVENYALTPSLPLHSAALQADGRTVRLTSAEHHGGQTYTLTVVGVSDLAANPVGGTANTATYAGVGIPPTVVSAVALGSTGVAVLFSEPLDAATANAPANYSLSPALAVSGAQLQADGKTVHLTTGEQTGGATHTVTVSGVKDASGNLIGATGNAISFTGVGISPHVVSAASTASTQVLVTFGEAVEDASANTAANYACTPTLSIVSAQRQADQATVLLTTAEQTGGTTYTLAVSGVNDLAGNPIGPTANTAAFTGTGDPPRVTGASAVDSTHVDVAFSEPLDPASAVAVSAYAVTPALVVGAAELRPDGKTVRLTTPEQTGSVPYTVTVTGVRDAAGNPVGTTNRSATFTGTGVSPQVVSASAPDSTHVEVLFSEPLDAATANAPANYSLSPALAVSGAQLQTDGKSVHLSTPEQRNAVAYTVTVSGVKDLAKNPVGATGRQATFPGVGIPPQVVSAVSQPDGTHVDVLFDEGVDTTTANAVANYAITPALAVTAAQRQTGGNTVRLATGDQTGGVAYTVTVSGVKDAAGNPVGSTHNAAGFTGVAPPFYVASLGATGDPMHLDVTFNRPVDPTTAGSPANYTLTPPIAISSAVLQANGKTVTLTTATRAGGALYTLTVSGVKDIAGNPIQSGSSTSSFTSGRLVFSSMNDLFVANGDGSGAVRLSVTSGADANPSWSPDGSRIAFDTGGDVYVANADGTGVVRLTAHPESDGDASWSPDGTRIAFISSRDSYPGVHTMSADGTDVAQTWAGGSDPVWSPDGQYIAFVSQGKVRVMTATGTNIRSVTSQGYVEGGPAWSPDGRRIAFSAVIVADKEICVANTDGTGFTRLTTDPATDDEPSWAEDGSRILFTSTRGGAANIYSMAADGTGVVRLTNSSSAQSAPSWSGGIHPGMAYTISSLTRRVILSAGTSDTYRLTVTVRDGSYRPFAGASVQFATTLGAVSPASAVTDTAGQAVATVTGTGAIAEGTLTAAVPGGRSPQLTLGVGQVGAGEIAFASLRDGPKVGLYTMDPDGARQSLVISPPQDDSVPAWSPDGSRIAFASGRVRDAQNYNEPGLFVMNADGTGAFQLGFTGGRAAWSPSGQRIVFKGGLRFMRLFVVNSDGTGNRDFTASGVYGEPRWAPDGRHLVLDGGYLRAGTDPYHHIQTVNADGSGRVLLTTGPGYDAEPAWSPDGTRIVFTSDRDHRSDPVHTSEIYVMSADGTGVVRLTQSNANYACPVWSPDGKRIAFVSDRDGDNEIYVVNADGTGVAQLTHNTVNDMSPNWSWGRSASGRAFSAPSPRRTPITRLRAACAGMEAEARLTDLGLEPTQPDSSRDRGASLRFVPGWTGDGRQATAGGATTTHHSPLTTHSPQRAWEFSLEGTPADGNVTLSWPDLSGLGSRDRVTLEDLDAGTRRSMRTTASYTFRAAEGQPRRFRVVTEARSAGPLLLTGLDLAGGRGGVRVARFQLSADASVDLDLLSPSGRTVAALARGRASTAGMNEVAWRAAAPPGVYLLRATATTEEGTAVQAVRPVVLAR